MFFHQTSVLVNILKTLNQLRAPDEKIMHMQKYFPIFSLPMEINRIVSQFDKIQRATRCTSFNYLRCALKASNKKYSSLYLDRAHSSIHDHSIMDPAIIF